MSAAEELGRMAFATDQLLDRLPLKFQAKTSLISHGKVIIVETKNCDFCAACQAVCLRGAIKCAYSIVLSSED